ncbi:hypothetical protein [Paraburkholderia azotifigens]|uniref:hypothetical protein n=1 Tax=Paraburkholderia azotifigens TaxID=2057004 RepID=UPI001F0315E7|nr:hypothetical protein [Paraburkholderia azotifigens]
MQLGGTVLYRRLREMLAPHPLRYLSGDMSGDMSGDGVPPGLAGKSSSTRCAGRPRAARYRACVRRRKGPFDRLLH